MALCRERRPQPDYCGPLRARLLAGCLPPFPVQSPGVALRLEWTALSLARRQRVTSENDSTLLAGWASGPGLTQEKSVR